MRVPANGCVLNALIEGPEDGPCLTLLGGIANDHRLWAAHAPVLSRSCRVLRIDGRGHGLSDSTLAPYSLTLLANDVAGVWDAFGIERSVVAGLGLGGVVAAEIAHAMPARVSALVPISCRAAMTPPYAAIWPAMVERARAGGMAAIAQTTLERWFSEEFRSSQQEQIESVRAAILATSLEGYLGSIAALLTLDWAGRLGGFRMPVLYVSGENDRVGAPPEIMQAMCDATPGAKHVVLPGATHISPVCNPAAFNSALERFIAAIPPNA